MISDMINPSQALLSETVIAELLQLWQKRFATQDGTLRCKPITDVVA